MTALAEGTGTTVPSGLGAPVCWTAACQAGLDLHSRAVETMGARIVAGELAPGSTFRLRDLAADLGTSLSVAREAARVLEALGLLAAKRRLGVTVLAQASWQMLDPRIVRWHQGTRGHAEVSGSLAVMVLGVAPHAALLAAANASDTVLAEICSCALSLLGDAAPEQGAAGVDGSAPPPPLARLVRLVVSGAQNPLYNALADMFEPTWLPLGGTPSRDDVIALAVALTQRDGIAAHRAMAALTTLVCRD
jgi:DNA-binding FadR family transcriptional regulator